MTQFARPARENHAHDHGQRTSPVEIMEVGVSREAR
jgi:hypothetical protein